MTDSTAQGANTTPAEIDWDQRYDHPAYLFGTRPNSFLAAHAASVIPSGGRVLAVADGEGRNSVWLAEQGYDVDAVDGSAVAVAKAQRLAAERGVSVRYTQGDVTSTEWPDATYDAVVAIFIQFLRRGERDALWSRLHQTLRPGGVLLLIGYTPKQHEYRTGGPAEVEKLYVPEDLRAELSAFTLDHFEPREYEVDEGPGHRGMSAVLEVVARR